MSESRRDSGSSVPLSLVVSGPSSSSVSPVDNSTLISNGRNPQCARCRNHQVKRAVKGHKRYCPYATCICDRCILIVQRQDVMKKQNWLKRKNVLSDGHRDLARPVPGMDDGASTSSDISATISSPGQHLTDSSNAIERRLDLNGSMNIASMQISTRNRLTHSDTSAFHSTASTSLANEPRVPSSGSSDFFRIREAFSRLQDKLAGYNHIELRNALKKELLKACGYRKEETFSKLISAREEIGYIYASIPSHPPPLAPLPEFPPRPTRSSPPAPLPPQSSLISPRPLTTASSRVLSMYLPLPTAQGGWSYYAPYMDPMISVLYEMNRRNCDLLPMPSDPTLRNTFP